jgi:hypothetical protein
MVAETSTVITTGIGTYRSRSQRPLKSSSQPAI